MGNRVTYEDLADLASKGGSGVTYDDLKDLDPDLKKDVAMGSSKAPAGVRSLLQSLGSLGKSALTGGINTINNTGGGFASGVGKGGAALASIPHDIFGVGPNVQYKAQAPFSNPNSLLYKGAQMVGQAVPSAALAETGLPALESAPIVRNALLGAATGFGATPGDVGTRGINAGVGAAVGSTLPLATKAKNVLTGKFLDNLSSQLFNKLSGGLDKNALNTQNMGNLINNYNAQKNIGSGLFNKFLQDAQKLGYPSEVSLGTPGISLPPTGKPILPTSDLNLMMDKISNPDENSGIQKVSSSLQNAISKYRSSPSLTNAHRLQSAFGDEATNFLSKTDINPDDRITGNLLKKAKEATLDSVSQSLAKNGDSHLNSQFLNSRAYWRNNVIPYENNSQIMQAVKGNPFGNVTNLLSKDDDTGNLDTIRDHLAQNPNQTNSLAAQFLSRGVNNLPKGQKALGVNALNKAYNSMPDILREMMDPTLDSHISRINSLKKGYDVAKVAVPMIGLGYYGHNLLGSL